ncbi:MAG: glycosyltransferase family 2 protein [Eggerthellaceae bacterium]|nr:glycosyltransferase family 2 protein [Eggerthellaceae bacterium]
MSKATGTDEGSSGKGNGTAASKVHAAGTADRQVKVSVVIPVYNVEGYIERCIDSLQGQTLGNLEFIFVDDCSTDNSMAAVETWARQDDRVRILQNPENLGAGPSRNRGIEAARGEYLGFVDPDDYVPPEFFELLYTAATADGRHDIAKGLQVNVDTDGREDRSHGKRLNGLLAPKKHNIPLFCRFSGDHWTAIYHNRLFEDEGVRYGTTRKSQDTTFTLRVCLCSEDIVLEPRAEYFYCFQRLGSAINTSSLQRFYNEIAGLDEKIDALLDRGIDSHAYAYLADKLRYYTSCYRAEARYGNHLRDEYERYWHALEKTLSRLPEWHRALELNSYVDALYKSACFTTPGVRFEGEGSVRVSVILPVYNPGTFIDRCIDSLQQQLLDGLEFIFVDDCSTDGSMDKVEAWASQDDRVRILKNDENLGAGPSRNRGIEAARGDYLSFIDSDDYVSPEFYELLYAAATADGGHDIAKGCRRKIDGVTDLVIPHKIELNKRILEHQSKRIPLFRSFTYEHQTALYSTRLFKNGDVRYGQSTNAEDITFLLSACLAAKDIVLCSNAIYYYVQREESLVYSFAPRRFFAELDSFENQVTILKERGVDDDACQYLAVKLKAYSDYYENAAKEHHELDEIRQAYYQRADSILSSIASSDRIKELANIPKEQ